MSDNTKHSNESHFPRAGIAQDGWSNSEEATATCFCGAVQLAFPLKKPGYVGSFVCNCVDCRKITASMFASNFIVKDSHLRHLRGQDNLSHWGQAETIATGYKMTNYFCKTCGSLLYRVGEGFPGFSILRLGTVDDFSLVETVLKPGVEQFAKDRVGWLHGAQGIKQVEGAFYGTEKKPKL
ncbi:Glutathione-dependent formaldehyde-activating enzyme/centromere protein V [Kalmanozyma brasiliensis GHG001]|uniref:CENP-V/GFA domain-containing protein n=1 Tax=Kalmanozyma brasiliensis (strain GHG001) TaxID=1365824 RepID=V5ERS8_KALBG|nr:Glutathione-dependent formaldehyde-activating enzyme/centromere protein V [Kalmanozyma brasiliensis GHG001]EST05633.1 Glutathione-dependent formaldehyde-activating enzyme/centromere protein V [Kalmanozyma brasiliensis GHG001]